MARLEMNVDTFVTVAPLLPKLYVVKKPRPRTARICLHHGWPLAFEPAVTESPKHATLTGSARAPCAAARHAMRIERRFMVRYSLAFVTA